MPVTIRGFLPGENYVKKESVHTPAVMLIPVVILGFLSLWLGLFPGELIEYIGQFANGLL